VLDEADRMLTPTFASDLAFLLERMPEERQTVLFTATESDAIRGLAAKPPRKGKEPIIVRRVETPCVLSLLLFQRLGLQILTDARSGRSEGHLTVANLKQHYLFIPSHVRESYLFYLLLNPPESIAHLARPAPGAKTADPDDETPPWPPSTILFTQTCATAAHLHALLTELQLPSVPLHSYLSQRERLSSLAQFRAATVPILVATDVGSRGLDIPEVAMVVNWDCPREPDAYIHRVGRTARAGRGGVAVTMVTERDVEHVERIEEGISALLLTSPQLTRRRLAESGITPFPLSQRSSCRSSRCPRPRCSNRLTRSRRPSALLRWRSTTPALARSRRTGPSSSVGARSVTASRLGSSEMPWPCLHASLRGWQKRISIEQMADLAVTAGM